MDVVFGLINSLPPFALYAVGGLCVVWLVGFIILFVATGGSFPDDPLSCCIAPIAVVLVVVLVFAAVYFGVIVLQGSR